ncbi:MAG: acetyltransferase [Pseudomonadota bacterium]
MSHYDFFNGDADGICALHQLRLHQPRETTLVTGVKRDIALVSKVDPAQVTTASILDISFDKNRAGVQALLDAGANVEYFDHHFAGDIPDNIALDVHIDTAANVCTALLVDLHIGGTYRAWAVAASFGDNLFDSARTAAQSLSLSAEQLNQLEELGTLINYNGYGPSIDDLHFDPEELYRKISPYTDPFDFIANDPVFETLRLGYASDRDNALQLKPVHESASGAVMVLPEEKWSRRISGVFGNELARDYPERAHALLSSLPDGGYLVSVRAPVSRKEGADELCMQFATGGGRKAAAGINSLPEADVETFIQKFDEQFAA